MTHNAATAPPPHDRITADRLRMLKIKEKSDLLENFAIFIDTHRDQPHVGVFYDDIHRGACRPTKVHYDMVNDVIVNTETGAILPRHEKHLYVTIPYFADFLVQRMLNGESDPRDGDGCMPTSHFRDARAKVYELKSFREIVRLRTLGQA